MKRKKLKIGRIAIEAEVADNLFSMAKGLMLRESLEKNRGMLFTFPIEGHHSIWMFGMRFPIDIIWMDRDMRVVDIYENASPCIIFCKVYMPKKRAKYVLEVNSGFVKNHKIKLGTKISGI